MRQLGSWWCAIHLKQIQTGQSIIPPECNTALEITSASMTDLGVGVLEATLPDQQHPPNVKLLLIGQAQPYSFAVQPLGGCKFLPVWVQRLNVLRPDTLCRYSDLDIRSLR